VDGNGAMRSQGTDPALSPQDRDTYFVVVPYQGVETSSVQTQLGMIQDLAGPLQPNCSSLAGGLLFKVARPLDETPLSSTALPPASLGCADRDREASLTGTGVRLGHDSWQFQAWLCVVWRGLEPIARRLPGDGDHGQYGANRSGDVGLDGKGYFWAAVL